MAFSLCPFFFLLSTALPSTVMAGFQVLSWNLRTSVADPESQDIDRYLSVVNPWEFTSLASLNGGVDYSRAAYDYSWLRNLAIGDFHSTITHAIRSEEIRTVSSAQIFIRSDVPFRVSIDASLTYAHTPGDESEVRFSASIRNVATLEYSFLEIREGGNAYLQPSSGTLSFAGDAILAAGQTYRLNYSLASTNDADVGHPPTGIIDANGHVNFSITPEPTTLTLLALAAPWCVLCRSRR